MSSPQNASTTLRSALYTGWVRHRRFVPKSHAFRYPLMMWYLDLDEIAQVCKRFWFLSAERRNLISYRREDFYAPERGDLKQAVIARFADELNIHDVSRVTMLTHLRCLGYLFNPVTFYYGFNAQGQLRAILAEITNTPWGERHAYALDTAKSQPAGASGHHAFDFDKRFHVSPFNPMQMQYHWVFSAPGESLRVHMDNLMQAANESVQTEKHFDATLVLEKRAFEAGVGRALIRHPVETVKVTSGIYWQALKLWLKGVPFHSHPKYSQGSVAPADNQQELKG